MSRRTRDLDDEAAANQSDPDDFDYDDKTSPSKRRKIATLPGAPRSKKRSHRKREYSDDDDVIGSEDEDLSVSFNSDSDEDAPVEFTSAGRPKRRVTKNTANLRESSESDENFGIEEDDEESPPPRPRSIRRPSSARSTSVALAEPLSLIIKLSAFFNPSTNMVETRGGDRSRVAGKGLKSDRQTHQRRSSRHSEGPLYELTRSGRHGVPQESATPETKSRPASRAGKTTLESDIIEASQEDSQAMAQHGQPEDEGMGEASDIEEGLDDDDQVNPTQESAFAREGEGLTVAESIHSLQHVHDEDDDDEEPVRGARTRQVTHIPNRRTRSKQLLMGRQVSNPEASRRETRTSGRLKRKAGREESSDFDPDELEEDPEDDHRLGSMSPRKESQRSEASSNGRRSGRLASKRQKRSHPSGTGSEDSDAIDMDELADEAAELRAKKSRRNKDILYDAPLRRRRGAQPDYRVYKPETLIPSDDEGAAPGPSYRARRTGGTYRSLFSTVGPFGGAGGPAAMFTGPEGTGAAGGAESDSSDDDLNPKAPRGIGGAVGMTPTTAHPHPFLPQPINTETAQASGSGPANFGKVKDKKALADVDPLGVDQTVSFEGVGGLDNHINQLKEMVALPLLYPEVFQQFKLTPPRGVLFHGPPGTGKTLLARALAASVSSEGRKVTFYMRKGADALSKWVGEAERQLRLLFEEARKNQPSIIFFDEIDGLAPVRSSKQEQIHASIVATLLALMDGMDGRGQVIVIGATNRPDSVDPALRRPGRFDREFYFPLPSEHARRAILDIHTKGWDPPLEPRFKDQLANLTKGYGGADLRALCTEAALNAVQGTYPQIYKSTQKLIIDPTTIKIQAKDFMISISKMIPSSERSGGSGAAPIEASVEPLLRDALQDISSYLDEALPDRPKRTALEEAEYDDRDDDHGFDKEVMQQQFDRSRVYRPRLLIKGLAGMGQSYLGSAILHKFERLHVQPFDLPTLYNDATRTPEAAIVQLFNEVRRHRPSVIYLPNVNVWYETVGPSVVKMFSGLLRSLPPNEAVLVLGVMELESEHDKPDENMLRDLFGFSVKNQFNLERPPEPRRREYFEKIVSMIKTEPTQLPDPSERKKRDLPTLEVAPAPPQAEGPSKADLKAQKKNDMHTLNLLKISIQPIMDHIKKAYKKFRNPIIDDARVAYLFDEQNPAMLSTDLAEEQRQQEQYRPFEMKEDSKGVPGLLETATGKFYYNLEIITIERRLSNGYYKRYKDFLNDIKKLAKDARTGADEERTVKANELMANVEVDIQMLMTTNAALNDACERVYQREKEREKIQKEQALATGVPILSNIPPSKISGATTQSTGPITLGEPVPGQPHLPQAGLLQQDEHHGSQLTNGDTTSPDCHASHSNGYYHSQDEDVQMTDSQDVPHATHADVESSQTSTQQRAQRSALTAMAHNSQPGDYHNSASTTTSGQKTSDKSNRTQSSNGVVRDERPDFSGIQDLSGASQLPDTQDNGQSSSQSQQSPMGPPLSRQPTGQPASLANILNDPVEERKPQLVVDTDALGGLHDQLARRTSGCSVEQLEQVNAALMDAVWKDRGTWNRNVIIKAVGAAFNAVLEDMEQVQRFLPNTQSTEQSRSSGEGV